MLLTQYLVHRQRRGQHWAARVGIIAELQQSLDAAILTVLSVKGEHEGVDRNVLKIWFEGEQHPFAKVSGKPSERLSMGRRMECYLLHLVKFRITAHVKGAVSEL